MVKGRLGVPRPFVKSRTTVLVSPRSVFNENEKVIEEDLRSLFHQKVVFEINSEGLGILALGGDASFSELESMVSKFENEWTDKGVVDVHFEF